MPKKKHIFAIIDGNALVHRAWHALPPLTTKNGTLVNAAYGFTSILLKILKDIQPDYIAITFDPPGPTFRHEMFDQYKAQRQKQPDEFYEQIPMVQEIVSAFDFDIFMKEGYEADDVIGTIVKKLEQYYGLETLIVTGDMDTLQLVDEKTKVYTFKKSINDVVIYDEKMVKDRYGLEPGSLIDYKALRGDPSDNIPGVQGIGEKTAIELIQNFGSLENLYKNIENVHTRSSERVKKLLTEHKDDAFLSKELVTIQTNVPIKFYYKSCALKEYDRAKILDTFSKYEFKSLLKRIDDIAPKAAYDLFHRSAPEFPINNNYHLIADKKSFDVFLKKLSGQKIFAVDTETTGLNPFSDHIVGASFSWKANEGFYIPFTNDHKNYFLEKLRLILENKNIKKIGQNIKYDWEILSSTGIHVQGIFADTMIASYLLNPGTRGHNLDNLSFVEFGHEKIPIEELIGTGKNQITMDQVDLEKISQYAAEDADFTWRLWEIFEARLEKANVTNLFFSIEMPLVEVLGYMEREGVAIDTNFFKAMSRQVHKKIQKVQREIYKMAGTAFNIASTQQLTKILFDALGLSTQNIKKGKTRLSTSERELEKLKGQHPIIEHILEYRELSKLQNTYLEALPELINPKTKRIHTSFNQTITATGRLSSSNPNLQNIPIRTELGRKIRQGFVAQNGFSLISADYSQIELRVIASLANDKKMIEIFKKGKDIHTATAAEINHVPLEEVTRDMRYAAKEVNFGVLYGMGAFGLSERTGISRTEAKQFIDTYFESFNGVKQYIDEIVEITRQKGYVETLFGRIRNIPEINSSVWQVRAGAERMAINMPVQGTAADLMKLAMIHIHERLKKEYAKHYPATIKMILQVHDELVFEVCDDLVSDIAALIKQEMENVTTLRVPIVAEVKAGKNWGEMLPL